MTSARIDMKSSAGVFVLSFVALIPFHFGDFMNMEEWHTDILSNVMFAKALLNGNYLTWTDLLGLGVPMPLEPSQIHHPLVILFGLTSPSIALSIFYQVHMTIAAYAFWALCRHYGVSAKISLICVATFLSCASTVGWSLIKLLPSIFFEWSMVPVIFLLAALLLDCPVGERKRLWAISLGLGLSVGFSFLNAHAVPISVHLFILLIFFVINLRATLARRYWILLSGLICILIVPAKIYPLLNELVLFPSDLARNSASLLDNDAFFWHQFLPSLFIRPLFVPELGLLREALSTMDMGKLIDSLSYGYFNRYTGAGIHPRGGFMGPPFVFLTFSAVWFACRNSDGNLRSITAVSLISFFVMLFVPDSFLYLFGRDFIFRDGFFIFGIIAAGVLLTHWASSAMKSVRIIAAMLVTLQLIALIGALGPTWVFNLAHKRPHDAEAVEFYSFRDFWKPSPFIETVKALEEEQKTRVYFGQIASTVLPRRGVGAEYNVLAYHGIRQVNATAKGIFTGNIESSDIIMEGVIAGNENVVKDSDMLDALAVTHVFAARGSGVAPDLEAIGSVTSPSGEVVDIYINKDIWPEAVALEQDAERIVLSKISGCDHDGLLCRDFTPIGKLRRADVNIDVQHASGDILLTLPDGFSGGQIMIPMMYRPEWRATTSGSELEVSAIFDSLVSIEVPPGTRNIRLYHYPTILYACLAVSYFFMALAIAGIVLNLFLAARTQTKNVITNI